MTNSFVLQTSIPSYKTDALITTALNLRILKTSLTYNTDTLLNAISSLVNYRTITQDNTNLLNYVLKNDITGYTTTVLINAALALKLDVTAYNIDKSTFLTNLSLSNYRTSTN